MIKIFEIIGNNFLAKLLSLILAVATWFYVFDLVNNESYPTKKETVEQVLDKYRFISRDIPVKPVFSGKSPSGYKVLFDEVKVTPSYISVMAPEQVIEKVSELKTDRIDINEYTRTTTLRLGIHSDTRSLRLGDKIVDVYLPITAIEGDDD